MRLPILLCTALAATGCYTLKGPKPVRPPMSAQDYANVDSTRRKPDGSTYKYYTPQRGAHANLKEATIQGVLPPKAP